MQNASNREIELYPLEVFKTLLEHEVNKSRRYGDSLTLIDLLLETEPSTPDALHSAQTSAIHVLHLHLRDVDISCLQDNEFLILMPSTSAPGARTACERVRKLMLAEYQNGNGAAFKLSTFIGLASMPADHSLSSAEFIKNASLAVQHARANHLTGVVAFSEILQ